jgi:carbon-monoxide dehydrogenase medium subunit
MMNFELAMPQTLDEAIALLDPEDRGIRPIGGATAIMLMMKIGVFQPTRLVSLRGIEARYATVERGDDGALHIGGLTPLAVLERSPLLRDWPVLTQTLKTLSNIRVRNVATIGGHLAHADPHMDLPPVLSALDAQVVIAGPSGQRTLPVEQLCTGYYETSLALNELIIEVIVPPLSQRRAAYLKCTTRTHHDWPALGLAVVLQTAGDTILDSRIFLGAATDKPTRLNDAEAVLRGSAIDDAALRRAGEAGAESLSIVGDTHGSAPYKKQLLRVYLGRAVRAALASTNAQGRA